MARVGGGNFGSRQATLKRNFLSLTRGGGEGGVDELALLWVLNLSDGAYSLLDIAERSGCPFDAIKRAADAMLHHHLFKQLC